MVDFGNAISGAVKGGATGAAGGPWTAAAGAVTGGLLGLFGSKKKKKKKKVSAFDPQQQELYSQHNQAIQGQGPMADLYNWDANQANDVFEKNVANPAYRNFNENIVPRVTGEFRSNNLQNSSYAADALARHGRDVQESLNAKRADIQFSGQQNAQTAKRNAIENTLNRSTFAQPTPTEKAPSTIDQILNSVGPQASQWIMDYIGKKNSSNGIQDASSAQFKPSFRQNTSVGSRSSVGSY